MSFSLLGLETEVVAVVAVVHLNLTCTCNRKSLGRSLMCLNLSHFYILLMLKILQILFCCFCVDRGDDHAHYTSVDRGLFVHCADLGADLRKFVDYLTADSHVAHFTSAESHNYANLIACLEEFTCLLSLGFKVVGVDTGRELNLLKLNGLLLFLRFLLALLAFKAEFTEVHYLAHGGCCLRCHKAEVETFVICHLKGLLRAHNTKLFAFGTYYSDLREVNIFIGESIFRIVCCYG